MNSKYLLLKFAFVFLLVALCLGSLFWGSGLKMGPDIAGGYSMTFEVYNDEKRGDLIDRVIAILKKRIDPTGLSSLEWRPLKNDRFEVRMPAASEASQKLRDEYLKAQEALLAHNVERNDIRGLLHLNGEARQKSIDQLATKDPERAKCLKELLAAMEKLNAAEENVRAVERKIAKAKSPSKQQLQTLQEELQSARTVQEQAAGVYRLGLDSLRKTNINARELVGVLKLYDEIRAQTQRDARRAARQAYQTRLTGFEEAYPAWKDEIAEVARLYTQWADVRRALEDPSDLIRLIRKAGVLEFRIAPYNPDYNGKISESQISQYKKSLEVEGPEALRDAGAEYAWYPILGDLDGYDKVITQDYAGRRYVLLSNRSGDRLVKATGDEPKWSLTRAWVGSDQLGSPAVDFRFDEAGAKLFARLTGANKQNQMAILLDNEVYSAPTIQAVISSQGQITGKFTIEAVEDLARILEAGSLPGRVNPEPVSQNNFSPALGQTAIHQALRSGIYGLIAVTGFMVLYYMLGGAIADIALLLNIVLVLGSMSLFTGLGIFQAVLTLPGVAGVILTIGMAVDANVLIFERLREEQARGLAVRQALRNAYDRAFTAIFDSNITTLLTCLFLFVVFDWVGMEEVRGFAITLGLGVTFSMFTALVVTRWIFQWLLDIKVIRKPLPMLRLVPKVNVNWMGKRYYFWAFSAVVMVMGVTSLFWQGEAIWGIEFSSGTQAMLTFRDDALIDGQLPNDGLVRRKIGDQAAQLSSQTTDAGHRQKLDKLIATARVETVLKENKASEFLAVYGDDKGQVTRKEWADKNKNPRFFELLDANHDGVLNAVELKDRLPERTYQMSTTVNDAKLVADVANDAFGASLQRRLPCKFDLARNRVVPQLGISLSPDGATRITPEVAKSAAAAYRDELLDFEDGFCFVVENVTPPLTVTELQTRIRDVRMQPDFGQLSVNPYKVVGLTPAGNGQEGFSALVVLVRPADPDILKSVSGPETFARAEEELLSVAMEREEAMVITNFDPAIAGETAQLAIVAIAMSWLAIVAYLWIRFGSIRWGLAAVICLVHDVTIMVGLVAASGWLHSTPIGRLLGIGSFKIDLPMVAAILTIIGYSVNDTIVVFDRIRENRGKLRTVSAECINNSINQTLPRTLLTSFTTFLVVLIMYVWGGSGIKAFNYALMVGIIFGTYSSIAVASPLLLGFKQALLEKVTMPPKEEPNRQFETPNPNP